MIVDGSASDIVVTDCFTGVDATFLRPSLEANGLDPAALVREAGQPINIKDGGANARAWRDIWSAGQGIGAVKSAGPAAEFIDRLTVEYHEACAKLRAQIGSPIHRASSS
jgi:nitronate monooxygenase